MTRGVEALARVLSEANWHLSKKTAQLDVPHWREHAERILADPGPLLEALAEAGVLREIHAGDRNRVSRYVTEWRRDAGRVRVGGGET